MTTPLRTEPVGPITVGDSVAWCAIFDNELMVLIGNGSNIRLESFYKKSTNDPNPSVNSSTIIITSVSGSIDHLVLQIMSPQDLSGSLMVQSGKTESAILPALISVSSTTSYAWSTATSSYQRPPNGVVLLASVPYKIYGSLSGTLSSYLPLGPDKNKSTGVEAIFNGGIINYNGPLIPIPIKFFIKSGNACAVASDYIGAIELFYCSQCSMLNGGCASCIGENKIQPAWTREEDCGTTYDYCVTGQYCGNCYGGCASELSTCTFSEVDKKFNCIVADAEVVPLTFLQKYWIVLLIVGIIVILIVALVIYHYYPSSGASRIHNPAMRDTYSKAGAESTIHASNSTTGAGAAGAVVSHDTGYADYNNYM